MIMLLRMVSQDTKLMGVHLNSKGALQLSADFVLIKLQYI